MLQKFKKLRFGRKKEINVQPNSETATPLQSILQGSTNFKINNSILTNAQGDITIYKFDVGGPLTKKFELLFTRHVAGFIHVQDLDKKMMRHFLSQAIRDLPRVKAAYNDYTSSNLRRVACFEGTRQALLEEIAQWLISLGGPHAYLLFGIAGIGKSTVAHTLAERADNLRLLGASFFFSRDEADRRNAERFFTTIAFQLCAYDKQFSEAIGAVLTEDRGATAALKDPQEQLRALILEPLRKISQSRPLPTVIVIDALDECDDQDVQVVLAGLNRLVRELPCFKVMMTTRPLPHLPRLLTEHKVFHLQDIEEKIVDGDIRHYLKHSLAWPQVAACMPVLEEQWSATDAEIESLVQSAGRLFIMASTVVRFILDMTVHDPQSQMEELKTDGRVSLHSLGHFYNVILRRAVPPNNPSMARRFNAVIGTILVIQEPLPIRILEHLTDSYPARAIKSVLTNLQSVIMLNDDTPRIYHKSFFDFLTDPHHCDEDLLVNMNVHHTQVAIRCFQIMNKHLKQNILDLGTPARFMDNADGIAAENISPEQLVKKIPGELRYACIYWANHIRDVDSKDVNLTNEVHTFVTVHLLHWLEVLSWIGKLEVACSALRAIPNDMSTSSDLSGIISDALHFILKFYKRIHQSAPHTYYSSLSFTPTKSLLYEQYSKEMMHGLCQPEGVPPQWDALITNFAQGLGVHQPVFSPDSSKFSSSSKDQRQMRLWNGENGILLRTYDGDKTAIAGDFSVAAISQDDAVTLWNVASHAPVTTVTQSGKPTKLALSFDGSRLAVGLSDGTVGLWDAGKGELIATLGGYDQDGGQLEFAPTGNRLAFMTGNGTIRLWNGDNGGLIATLDYELRKHTKFVFSRDGRRLLALMVDDHRNSLTLWDGEKGTFIDIARDAGHTLAAFEISEDGSFIAVGGWMMVDLWGGSPLSRVDTCRIGREVYRVAVSCGILAVATLGETLTLYDVEKRAVVATVRGFDSESLALSPDCTRLVVGAFGGGRLYDVPLLKVSGAASEEYKGRVLALALSPDTSRLASGLKDGTTELWDTNRTDRPIASYKLHASTIHTLAFSFDGERFSSGSADGIIRFWSGRDGAPISKLTHSLGGAPSSMAFSPDLLAVGKSKSITFFNHKSFCFVDTLNSGGDCLSFSADGSLLASTSSSPTEVITVWHIAEHAAIATFTAKPDVKWLTFSPDNSQLAARSRYPDGSFEVFDIVNKRALELTGHEDLGWVSNLTNDALVSWKFDNYRIARLLGRFPGHHDPVAVLCIAEEFDVKSVGIGSSMLALGCYDGRILFIRFPTTSIT